MAEINVVPYIDVMLVLLIIFMITAPLITQGVKVDLPKVSSEVLPPEETPPLIVSVDRDGRLLSEFRRSTRSAGRESGPGRAGTDSTQ